MLTGQYERNTINVIENYVQPGDVCFDIGANVGAITFAIAKKITPIGKVYAFEPGPPIFKRLVNNISMNPLYKDSIIAENLGVSDSVTKLLWAEDTRPDGRGNGGMRSKNGTKVSVITLDSYCEMHQINKVDFIKIDVEGMEYEVLKGSERILKNIKPLVYFETLKEFNETKNNTLFQSVEDYLSNLDYIFYAVDNNGDVRLSSHVGLTSDTLAIPKE